MGRGSFGCYRFSYLISELLFSAENVMTPKRLVRPTDTRCGIRDAGSEIRIVSRGRRGFHVSRAGSSLFVLLVLVPASRTCQACQLIFRSCYGIRGEFRFESGVLNLIHQRHKGSVDLIESSANGGR